MKSTHFMICMALTIWLMPRLSNAQSINNKNTKSKEVNMSANQKNKEVIRELYEQSLNKRNMGLLQDLISADYTGIQGKKGADAFETPVVPLIKAFPDIHWTIEDLFGEGDKVVVRWKWEGTQTGQFTSYAATGKTISNEGMAIFEFKDGKIIDTNVQTDRLSFLQGLEVLPLDLSSLSNKHTHKNHINFIDKFFIPASARPEFYKRMSINRNFIKKLPGFIEDAAYEYTDGNGNLICITIAQWENMEAIDKAREAVQAEYKKEGFDMAGMFKRLNIQADRGIYKELEGH